MIMDAISVSSPERELMYADPFPMISIKKDENNMPKGALFPRMDTAMELNPVCGRTLGPMEA